MFSHMMDSDCVIDGKFRLLHKVGKGGNGEVFAARQLDLDRIVAIKFTESGKIGDDLVERRFTREASILATLRHPGIVPVYMFGVFEGRQYFVSELVEGRSLQQIFDASVVAKVKPRSGRDARAHTLDEGSAIASRPDEGSAIAPRQDEGSAIDSSQDEGSAIASRPDEGSAIAPRQDEGSAIDSSQDEGSAIAFRQDEGSAIAPIQDEGSAIASTRDGAAGAGVKFDERVLTKWLIDVCRGLSAAHEAGILHRDVKPSNIIVDETNRAKLIDFGLAKRTGVMETQKLTMEQTALGTVGYMSPEQCLGKPTEATADLYSIGCILYRGLVGKEIFSGVDPISIMWRHLNEPLPNLTYANTRYFEEFEPILHRLLAKNPEERYQSASAVADALERVTFAEPSSLPVAVKSDKALPKIIGITAAALAGVFFLLTFFSNSKQASAFENQLSPEALSEIRLEEFRKSSVRPALLTKADNQLRIGRNLLRAQKFAEASQQFRLVLAETKPSSDPQIGATRIQALLHLADVEVPPSKAAIQHCKQALAETESLYGKDSIRTLPVLQRLYEAQRDPWNPAGSKDVLSKINIIAQKDPEGTLSDPDLREQQLELLRISGGTPCGFTIADAVKRIEQEPSLLREESVLTAVIAAPSTPAERKSLAKGLSNSNLLSTVEKGANAIRTLIPLYWLYIQLGDPEDAAAVESHINQVMKHPTADAHQLARSLAVMNSKFGLKCPETCALILRLAAPFAQPLADPELPPGRQELYLSILRSAPPGPQFSNARQQLMRDLDWKLSSSPYDALSGAALIFDCAGDKLSPQDVLLMEPSLAKIVSTAYVNQADQPASDLAFLAVKIAPLRLAMAKQLFAKSLSVLSAAHIENRQSLLFVAGRIETAAIVIANELYKQKDYAGADHQLQVAEQTLLKAVPESQFSGAPGVPGSVPSLIGILECNRLVLACLIGKDVEERFRQVAVLHKNKADVPIGVLGSQHTTDAATYRKIYRELQLHQDILGPEVAAAFIYSLVRYYSQPHEEIGPLVRLALQNHARASTSALNVPSENELKLQLLERFPPSGWREEANLASELEKGDHYGIKTIAYNRHLKILVDHEQWQVCIPVATRWLAEIDKSAGNAGYSQQLAYTALGLAKWHAGDTGDASRYLRKAKEYRTPNNPDIVFAECYASFPVLPSARHQ